MKTSRIKQSEPLTQFCIIAYSSPSSSNRKKYYESDFFWIITTTLFKS